jgi:hypothetical protein
VSSAGEADAIEITDTATVYDNSRRDRPRIVAQLTAGTVIGAPTWPGVDIPGAIPTLARLGALRSSNIGHRSLNIVASEIHSYRRLRPVPPAAHLCQQRRSAGTSAIGQYGTADNFTDVAAAGVLRQRGHHRRGVDSLAPGQLADQMGRSAADPRL